MIDVSFDYFLTKHWQVFYPISLRVFIDQAYAGLLDHKKGHLAWFQLGGLTQGVAEYLAG